MKKGFNQPSLYIKNNINCSLQRLLSSPDCTPYTFIQHIKCISKILIYGLQYINQFHTKLYSAHFSSNHPDGITLIYLHFIFLYLSHLIPLEAQLSLFRLHIQSNSASVTHSMRFTKIGFIARKPIFDNLMHYMQHKANSYVKVAKQSIHHIYMPIITEE